MRPHVLCLVHQTEYFNLCVLMCLMWFKTYWFLYVSSHRVLLLMFPHVPYVVQTYPTINLSSKQRPYHFINFPALNQFNLKVFLINSFVVLRNNDFIKAQFFCFINTLFNTIHRSHFSR